jgi:hypothetical protein
MAVGDDVDVQALTGSSLYALQIDDSASGDQGNQNN